MQVVTLTALRHFAEDSVAEADGDGLDAGHLILAVTGDCLQLVRLFVQQQDRVGLAADEIANDLLHHMNYFAKAERGVELITGDVQAGEIVVLLFDLGVARRVILVLLLERAQLVPQPLIFTQELLSELPAFVEQLEKLLSSRFVAHLYSREGNTAVRWLRRFRLAAGLDRPRRS